MSDQAIINGFAYGWSSLFATVDGDPYFGLKSLSFGDKREVGYGYGMGRNFGPTSRTSGQYSVDEVKATMRLGSWLVLSQVLAVKGLGSYGNATFQLSAQWIEADGAPVSVEIDDCRVTAVTVSAEQNTDETVVELAISAMRLRWNGVGLYDDPLFVLVGGV